MCLTKEGYFELQYCGGGGYTDANGKPVDDLMDMGCVSCGRQYYTREKSPIEFCPACGFTERKRFKNFQELQKWSTTHSWKYLKITGFKPFGVFRGGQWRMTFALDGVELEMSGVYDEVHDLLPA